MCRHDAQCAIGQRRPIADHHGHLQSLAVWELFNAQQPAGVLPAGLNDVIRGFESGWLASDNKTSLAALFTEDALFQYGDDWLRGPNSIRMMLLGTGGPVRLRPQGFETNESLGHVAGTYGFYRDTTWVDQGRFVFTLRRAGEGG